MSEGKGANRPEMVSFGCRLNIWESEVMRSHAEAAGLNNAVIINSCAVTAEAEKQARQQIRKIKREKPEARIIVTGCAAQIHPELFAEMPEVAQVIGNHDKLQAETWQGLRDGLLAPTHVTDMSELREVASHMLENFSDHTRAFLQVQQGCDHRCTFCIIPYGRGPSRSVGIGAVIEAARRMLDNGALEIVLTGVDITSWGGDLPGQPKLGALVRKILQELPDLPRLRLSSLDPAEMDSELMAVLATEKRLMPHLHLSVQHGSDMILKRMKRRHLARDVQRFVDEARRRRPDVVFGADMITGFPTETQADHQASLDLINKAGITHLHVFSYSPREGTPAAKMPQIDRAIIKERTAALRALGDQMRAVHCQKRIADTAQLLLEKGNQGHLDCFTKAYLPAGHALMPAGHLCDVRVLSMKTDGVEVEII